VLSVKFWFIFAHHWHLSGAVWAARRSFSLGEYMRMRLSSASIVRRDTENIVFHNAGFTTSIVRNNSAEPNTISKCILYNTMLPRCRGSGQRSCSEKSLLSVALARCFAARFSRRWNDYAYLDYETKQKSIVLLSLDENVMGELGWFRS